MELVGLKGKDGELSRACRDDRNEYERGQLSDQGWFARLSPDANPGSVIADRRRECQRQSGDAVEGQRVLLEHSMGT